MFEEEIIKFGCRNCLNLLFIVMFSTFSLSGVTLYVTRVVFVVFFFFFLLCRENWFLVVTTVPRSKALPPSPLPINLKRILSSILMRHAFNLFQLTYFVSSRISNAPLKTAWVCCAIASFLHRSTDQGGRKSKIFSRRRWK